MMLVTSLAMVADLIGDDKVGFAARKMLINGTLSWMAHLEQLIFQVGE